MLEILPIIKSFFLALGSPTSPTAIKFKAEYTFEASREDELSINIGDIINVNPTIKTDDGWMWGECQGRVGVFPAAFTVRLSDLEPIKEESNSNFMQQQTQQPVDISFLPQLDIKDCNQYFSGFKVYASTKYNTCKSCG